MSELAIRKFTVLRLDRPPSSIEAGSFREFAGKARCRSRTETVQALRKGRSFFIERDEKQDYNSKAESLGRINVALEAFRNMSESGEPCYLHILTHDNAQLSFSKLPENGKKENATRREFARYLDSLVSQGTVVIITGNGAAADSSKR